MLLDTYFNKQASQRKESNKEPLLNITNKLGILLNVNFKIMTEMPNAKNRHKERGNKIAKPRHVYMIIDGWLDGKGKQ